MVQSVLYVNPVTGKDAVAGSAVASFFHIDSVSRSLPLWVAGANLPPQQNWQRIEPITSLVQNLSLPKADLKLLEIYEDRVTIPAYGDILLSLPDWTVPG